MAAFLSDLQKFQRGKRTRTKTRSQRATDLRDDQRLPALQAALESKAPGRAPLQQRFQVEVPALGGAASVPRASGLLQVLRGPHRAQRRVPRVNLEAGTGAEGRIPASEIPAGRSGVRGRDLPGGKVLRA